VTASTENQDTGADSGVVIQPWPQHSAQILPPWRGFKHTTGVRANPLFCERHKGEASSCDLRHWWKADIPKGETPTAPSWA